MLGNTVIRKDKSWIIVSIINKQKTKVNYFRQISQYWVKKPNILKNNKQKLNPNHPYLILNDFNINIFVYMIYILILVGFDD